MQAPRDSQPRGNNAGAPTLFGASPKPAAANDELRILSVLEPNAAKPRAKWVWPTALGVAAAACAGVVLWRAGAGSDTFNSREIAAAEAAPASAAAAPASAVTLATAQPAASMASSPSAAVIETLPPAAEPTASSPVLAQAQPAEQPASAAASPLALLADEAAPASAAPAAVAAAKPAHAVAKPQQHAKAHAHRTHVASKHARPKTASKKAAPNKEDADVDLLEAMVAHVRGEAQALGKAPAAAPQPASKP